MARRKKRIGDSSMVCELSSSTDTKMPGYCGGSGGFEKKACGVFEAAAALAGRSGQTFCSPSYHRKIVVLGITRFQNRLPVVLKFLVQAILPVLEFEGTAESPASLL